MMVEMQWKWFERKIRRRKFSETKLVGEPGQSAPEGDGAASWRDPAECFCFVIRPASRIL